MSNEYDDLVAGAVTSDKAQAARVGFVLSADTSPDAYAEAQRIARRTGVPVETALNMPKEIGKQARVAEMDFDALAKVAPATAGFLADVDKAKLAHDDVDNMAAIEHGFYKLGEYTVGTGKATISAVPKFNEGAWGAAYAVTEGWARVADALAPGSDNQVRQLANYFASLGRQQKAAADKLMPRSDNILGASWYSGMQSLGLNTLQLPLGAGGKIAPVLASMGTITGGQSYLEARDKGVAPGWALAFATSQGVIEAGTEMIGMPALFSILKPGQFLHKAAEYMVKEQGGEQLATALQDLNEWATLPENKDKTIGDYLADRPSAALQTALSTAFSGGGQVALMKGVELLTRRNEQAAQAAPFADALASLNKLAEASKVRERDSETAQAFFQSITDEGTDSVWISPQALAQSGVANVVAQAVPAVAEQIDSAVVSGHDIRLPIADLLAQMPGPELDALIPHVASEPGGFTQTTAKEYLQSGAAQELQAEVEKAMQDQQADAANRQEIDAIKADIKGQMDAAARFTPQVNDAYSSMVGNFYAVQAARLGITPEEMYKRYPLKVVAERIDGQQFEQGMALRVVDVFGNGSRVDHYDDKKGLMYSAQRFPTGIRWTVFEAFHADDGGDQVLGEMFKYKSLEEAQAAVRGLRISATQRAKSAAKYGAIPNLWKGEEKKVAKALIDAGVGIERFASSTQSRSKYLYLDSGLKVRLADHVLPGNYDQPDVDYRYGGDIKALVEEVKKAEEGAPTPDSRELGSPTLSNQDAGAASLRADESGQLAEPAQSGSGAGSEANITGSYGQNNGVRGRFNPATMSITLLKNADLSTFLHESGHFFLEVMADMAARPDTPSQVQQDMAALLQWFGLKDLNEWHGLDFEEKRAYHEKFARGFEAYLYEGKAPSIEVQGLFQRFRAWLLQVYKSLQALNVELTDEVRGVMDRMLASSEQIRLAEQARNMLPIFETAEQAGMSVEEFAAYHALGSDASNEAVQELQAKGLRDMRWMHNARGRVIKKLQKEAKARRLEVQIEARREVMAQPIYQAWQFLTGKITAEDRVAPEKQAASSPNVVDSTSDSLFEAIAKLGGIDHAQLVSEWGLDPAEKARAETGFGGKPVVNRKGGASIDEMGMRLAELGYLATDENGRYDQREFEEKFFDGLGGHDHHSLAFDYNALRKPGEQIANPKAMAAGRFDKQSVLDMGLPDHVVDRLSGSKMLAKVGLHPDVVAAMFGFTSGDQLVRELATVEAPKYAIEGLTDQKMLEQYGELASPEAIEREADKAVHNDVRMRMVATELAALERATGPKRTLAPAAKAFAEQMVARLKVRDLRPSQYANGEARSAKAAGEALKKGDVAMAASEKRNQLIQGYAAKATYNARDEVEAGVRYLKKFDGQIKNLDPEYQAQIAALLERFDLRKISNKEVARRASLAEWAESQREQGLEPDIPADLLNEALRTPYKSMTLEAFRGLVDTVKQIEHLGRLKHKLLTALDQRTYEEARDFIVASINEHAQGREADTRTPTTNLGRIAQGFRRFWAAHIKVASWARIMDGGRDGGPVWEYFIRSANERGDSETRMRAEATAKLSEILAPVFAQGKMGGAGQYFPSIKRSLNREARIAIALNTGNEGNLQRLIGGEGWTVQQLLPVLESLTKEEWAAVQAVWDHFESYRPLIGAKEMRVYGKEPQWVEHGSSITLQFGLRGGYYPIKYDSAASQRAEEHSDAEAAKRQLQGAYTSATTRRSFTKARVEEVNGRPLLYTLAGVYSGVNDVIHDLNWHEWLIDANRLMRSQSIDAAIRGHYGPEVKAQFKAWAADIAAGERGTDSAVEHAIGRMRQGVSAAGLGFNVMSAMIQPLGITQSMVRIGTGWAARGVAKYVANPIGLTREVTGKSSFMAERSRTRFRELNELRNQVQDQTAFREVVGRYAYWLMMRFQQMVDVPTWQGAYEKALASGADDTHAVALADQAVIDAQGSGMTKDLSAIERGGPLIKLFTTFYSFMNTALNVGVQQTMTANTPAKKGKLAADYLLLYVVPAVLGLALKNALTPGDSGDDDDLGKLAKRLAAAELDYLMGLMVIVREFSDVGKTLVGANDLGRDYTGPAGLRLVTDAGKAAKQTAQGEFDDGFRKALVNLVGDVAALPSAQINRTVTGAQALKEGKTVNPAALVFGFQEKH